MLKMASRKKERGQLRNGCRLMAKNSKTSIQVNFGLIPSEAGMRQHKLTCIVDNKIFAIYLYHHSHFLTAPFVFTTFFTLPILNKATTFFTARLFLSSQMRFPTIAEHLFLWLSMDPSSEMLPMFPSISCTFLKITLVNGSSKIFLQLKP